MTEGERFKSYADLAQALAPYSSTAPTPATLGLRFLAGAVDMALVWVIAVLSNLTVIHRMIYTWQEARRLEDAQLRAVPNAPEAARRQ